MMTVKQALAASGALALVAASGTLFLVHGAPQESSLIIPDEHPRLYWTPERLAQARIAPFSRILESIKIKVI